MAVVLLSLALVTVVGAVVTASIVIQARRRGAALVNRHTVRHLTGHRPPRRVRRRRHSNVFLARQQRTLDLTPLVSQGLGGSPRSGARVRGLERVSVGRS